MKLRTFTMKHTDWDRYRGALLNLQVQFDTTFTAKDIQDRTTGDRRTTTLLEKNGNVIGSIYGQALETLTTNDFYGQFDPQDTKAFGMKDTYYINCSAILPTEHGKKYYSQLRRHFEDYLRMRGISYLMGHTDGKLFKILTYRGAEIIERNPSTDQSLYEQNLWKQDKDNNSACYALAKLLYENGYKMPLSALEVSLKGTSAGTPPINIEEFLEEAGITYKKARKLVEGCLVNFQYFDRDQYGVISVMSGDSISLYNPVTGTTTILPQEHFEKIWYSNYYGKKWAITIKPKPNAPQD